ncbi:MAG: transglutaminase family protein [Acidimicrobiales bacterium]
MVHLPSPSERQVACELGFTVAEGGVTLVLQVAPAAGSGDVRDEELILELDGRRLTAGVIEVPGSHGNRAHVVRSEAGELHVAYRASVRPVVAIGEGVAGGRDDATDPEALVYLRQSRYCPSDEMGGFAAAELAHLPVDADRPRAIAEWVFERLAYEGGASGPNDTAIDTLMAGRGVCRDFAHLTAALCRAVEIPARVAAVYAPGLSPMDFHAVAEVRVDGAWQVLDSTRLAPRSALVRIATGRDAADTAFASTFRGQAELVSAEMTAVIDGDLPPDDHVAATALA